MLRSCYNTVWPSWQVFSTFSCIAFPTKPSRYMTFWCAVKTLSICDEYYEFRIADLLFRSSFIRLYLVNKANIVKGKNYCEPSFAWTTPADLKVLGQTCTAFYYIGFMFFICSKSLKSTSEKYFEHALHSFQQIRSWSSNYSLDFNVLT